MSFLDDLKAQKGLGKKKEKVILIDEYEAAEMATCWSCKKDFLEADLFEDQEGEFQCKTCQIDMPSPDKKPKPPRFTCKWEDCDNHDDTKLYKNGYRYCPGHYENMVEIYMPEPKEEPKKFEPVPGQITRERWLKQATVLIEEKVMPEGLNIPNFRVSIGFPHGSRGSTKRTLGIYYPSGMTSDGTPQIFISPQAKASGNVVEMLAVLVHEMIHAAHPGEGHGKTFRKTAKACGLDGPMTATHAGPELMNDLEKIARELGEFPHGTIDITQRKKAGTRMLSHKCNECGLIFYITQKWIDHCKDVMHCPDQFCSKGRMYSQ